MKPKEPPPPDTTSPQQALCPRCLLAIPRRDGTCYVCDGHGPELVPVSFVDGHVLLTPEALDAWLADNQEGTKL